MAKRKCYQKKSGNLVTAVRMDLMFDEFTYQKWNASQHGKPGDWLVNNNNDVYTVDNDYFRKNYKYLSPGAYEKIGTIWAEVAEEDGSIETVEGSTAYIAGDYLVYDREVGGTGYAVSKQDFERMYSPKDEKKDLTPEQKLYLQDTIKPKLNEFADKAKINKRLFFTLQSIAIIAAVFVPIISGFNIEDIVFYKYFVSLLGGLSALIAFLLGLFKFQGNWITYQGLYHELEYNISQYTAKVGPYTNGIKAYNLLVSKYQNILQNEASMFKEKHSKEFKIE
jgi:hypothetical protein